MTAEGERVKSDIRKYRTAINERRLMIILNDNQVVTYQSIMRLIEAASERDRMKLLVEKLESLVTEISVNLAMDGNREFAEKINGAISKIM